MTTPDLPAVRYATFTRRFRALLIDTSIVFGVVTVDVIVGDVADSVPGSGRVALLVMFGALLLYEPLLVWLRGATVGHAVNHLVVLDEAGRTPGLGRSFARYFVKVVLGLPSFVTMALTRKHQAVHDLMTHTTVQVAADVDVGPEDFHVEEDTDAATLPSAARRSLVMGVYLVAAFFAYGIALLRVDPSGCSRSNACSSDQRLLIDGVTMAWFLISMGVIVAAWKGRLLGARRVIVVQDD
jgi:uncharacterized RDD family membrane protein YckC